MRYQPIYDIAELCFRKGLTDVVMCPGSRCAPLTLAFARHTGIRARTFSDERSAAFVALGMAQHTGTPGVLLCTSGTAAYNFAPAVAEAFLNQVPLVVFTADRPSEWIAQHDGQTIFQPEMFGKHVKRSFQLPQDYDHADSRWAINRIVNEAINLARQEPRGPVHINAPFREPLYPAAGEAITYSTSVRVMEEHHPVYALTAEQRDFITTHWPRFNRILVVAGQDDHDSDHAQALHLFLRDHAVPVIGDIISNLHTIPQVIRHADLFLGQASEAVKKSLQPDLLITFGKSVISKNLKTFLRSHPPQEHWHIQPAGLSADTFQTITQIFHTTPPMLFDFLRTIPRTASFESQKQHNFHKFWEVEERRTQRTLSEYFPQETLGELEVVQEILKALPAQAHLHLSNSMSVRYANFIGLQAEQLGVSVYVNRGTSGIDGCTSTAVGHALTSDVPQVLITGDLAFFYDRNAFWHNYPMPNLRVLLLNNHGGLIFSMIDGPGTLPESQEYFVTRQRLTAKKLCEEFDFDHLHLDSRRKLKNLLKDFFEFDGRAKILEFESDAAQNKTLFDNLKQKIKKSYEL